MHEWQSACDCVLGSEVQAELDALVACSGDARVHYFNHVVVARICGSWVTKNENHE